MIRRSSPFILLLIFFALALSASHGDSPTMDEQNHIARGLSFLRTGDPRLCVEHPPLVNSISALPLLFSDIQLPLDDWSWNESEWYRFAGQLLWQVNQDAERIVFMARIPIIGLGLLLGAVLYRAVKLVFKSSDLSPLLTLALVVFDPNILAHAHYATNDLGFTFFIFLAAFVLWWAAKKAYSSGSVLIAGAALGLALGSKFSALVFCPVFGLLITIDLIVRYKREFFACLKNLLRIAVLYGGSALVIVWALYGFQMGSLSDGGLVLPMPLFWKGIGTIFGFSSGGRPAFLLGKFSTHGFLEYFPIAFGVKTPLPVILLFLWSVVIYIKSFKSEKSRNAVSSSVILLPPLFYFVTSCFSALNLGYRHLLPVLPFLYLFIAGNIPTEQYSGSHRLKLLWQTRKKELVQLVAVIGCLAWLVAGDVNIYPSFISYFNEIVGPENGYNVLVDSNIDWGQDLKRLDNWIQANKVGTIKLAWFGSAPPSYYGIDYEPLPGLPHHFDLWDNLPFDPKDPEPGTYVISVSILEEFFRTVKDKTAFAWFRERDPDDRIGYSLLVYHVKGD